MEETLNRKDIKEIFSEAIAPLVTEFRASHDAHEKELERLMKQSTEHYANFKSLEDKLQNQIVGCQNNMSNTAEKHGSRVGNVEKEITGLNLRVDNVEKAIAEKKESSKWSIEIIVIIVVALIPTIIKVFEVISKFGG